MKYSIEQLEILFKIRLSGFNEDDMIDDNHTNDHADFDHNVSLFLTWIKKMEKDGKIEHLLNQYKP